jgi:hypothetical protein
MKILRLFGLAVASYGLAHAACPSATVDVYTVAGFSCTIGDQTYSNFTYVPSASGSAAGIPASSVRVTPVPLGVPGLAGLRFAGLLFTAGWGVVPNGTQDSLVSFKVSISGGHMIEGMLVMQLGSGSSATGAASIAETTLDPQISLITFNGTGVLNLHQASLFAGLSSLAPFVDIGLSGGTSGSARMSGVLVEFGEH